MPDWRRLAQGYWHLPPGPTNSIVDVPGVAVGHRTIRRDEPAVARTGVTVILPPADLPRERLPAAGFVFNGSGEMTGLHQVNEWGLLETPIALTGTAGVAAAMAGLQAVLYERCPEIGRTLPPPLPLVAECNDMFLSDVRHPIAPEDVAAAIRSASTGPVSWGAVGAGTGMVAFGLKGGIGSASRLVDAGPVASFVLGAVALVNFGQPGELVLFGRPLGHLPGEVDKRLPAAERPDGSAVVVLATDAPLDAWALGRLARRAVLAMARLGSTGRHASGDLFLAFSTANAVRAQEAPLETVVRVRPEALNPFFAAAVEAAEEAMVAALFAAEGMRGVHGHEVRALAWEEVRRRFEG